jgi:hypothetical protein
VVTKPIILPVISPKVIEYFECILNDSCILAELLLRLAPMYIISFTMCRKVKEITDTQYFRQIYKTRWAGRYKQFITSQPFIKLYEGQKLPYRSDVMVSFANDIPKAKTCYINISKMEINPLVGIKRRTSIQIGLICPDNGNPIHRQISLLLIDGDKIEQYFISNLGLSIYNDYTLFGSFLELVGWRTVNLQDCFAHLSWCLQKYGIAVN